MRMANYFVEHNWPRLENHARNVAKHTVKIDAIVAHIMTFTCRASHYIRRATPGRKYLPCDLSVRKMHGLFTQQNDVQVQVTYSLYYDVFRRQFNLGFGHPMTDVCATCASYRLRCKYQLVPDADRRREAALYILHRRRARKFYDLMNDTSDASVTVCFDMMQNLSLPKTPIGQANSACTCLRSFFIVVAVMASRSKMFISTCGRKTRIERTATSSLLP